VLIGIIAGYVVALMMGQVSFGNLARASYFAPADAVQVGLRVQLRDRHRHVPDGLRLGDRNRRRHVGITKGGAGREATDKEIEGATFADGLGTAVAGVFGGLPNTSFSARMSA
jgi:xanthine/uracil permease